MKNADQTAMPMLLKRNSCWRCCANRQLIEALVQLLDEKVDVHLRIDLNISKLKPIIHDFFRTC